jgi:hypothetical protein
MKILELSARENFGLFLRYEDGTQGVVDLSSLAGRGVFAAWLKPGVFQSVRLSEFGAPAWPDELDLCPDSLYLQLTGKKPEEEGLKLARRLIKSVVTPHSLTDTLNEGVRRIEDVATGRVQGLTEAEYRRAHE